MNETKNNSPFNALQENLHKSSFESQDLQSLSCWTELRVFLAVAKKTSYKGAAETLNSSYQTVSRQVKYLETLLGTKLTASTGRGITLTDKGMQLALYLQTVEEAISQIPKNLATSQKKVAGKVRISISEGLGGYWIAPRLARLVEEHTEIEVEITNITNMVDFHANQADIVVGLIPFNSSHIHCTNSGHIHLLPVVAQSYIERKGIPTAKNLSHHHFVQLNYYDSRLEAWNPWNKLRQQAKLSHFCNNSVVYAMMVKNGLGIGLLANYILMDEGFLPLDLDTSISFPLHINVLKENLDLKHIRLTFEALEELLGADSPWFSRDMILSAQPSHYDSGFRFSFNIP